MDPEVQSDEYQPESDESLLESDENDFGYDEEERQMEALVQSVDLEHVRTEKPLVGLRINSIKNSQHLFSSAEMTSLADAFNAAEQAGRRASFVVCTAAMMVCVVDREHYEQWVQELGAVLEECMVRIDFIPAAGAAPPFVNEHGWWTCVEEWGQLSWYN